MKGLAPAVVAVAVTATAAGAALAVNHVVAGFAALPEDAVVEEIGEAPPDAPRAAAARVTPPRARSKRQYIDDILARNIFDHTKVGLRGAAVKTGDDLPTDLKVRLLATLVAEPADFSSALIAEEGSDSIANGYGIGDMLHDAEIIAIEQRLIRIRRASGAIEILSMDEEDAPRPTAAAATFDEEDEGVVKLGENKYAVERSMVEQYLGDLDAVSRMARAIPHRGSDGQIDGYRLSGIRRNSALDKLGIKNGDIVHSVNGQALTSMQGAMSAYNSLQSDSNFDFEITRRGTKQTMDYEVR